MTIKAVYFDFGGVISRTEFQAPRQHLAESLGMEYDDLDKLVFASESSKRASIGEISEEDHWQAVMRRLRRPVAELERVRDQFFAGDITDRDLLTFLRSLRPRYKVGLISNAWSGLRAWIESQKFEDAFDIMIISAEVGMMKPEAGIYRLALEKLDVAPAEAVFVDDFPENVEGARAVGMQAIRFTERERTLKELAHLLR